MAKPQQGAEQNPPEDTSPVDPAVEAASEGRPSASEYKSTGNTLVRTRRGHQVAPRDHRLPLIDSTGVRMSADNAKAVVEEYPDYAFIDDSKED